MAVAKKSTTPRGGASMALRWRQTSVMDAAYPSCYGFAVTISPTLPDALREATDRLAGISETPRLDAELLMAHALNTGRSDMLLRQVALAVPDEFEALIERRMTNEPIAYITGSQAFWDLDLAVTPDVLIPRADSETLIQWALDHFADTVGPARILDLGTGSGALILAALSVFPDSQGVAIDVSNRALQVAADNAKRSGFGARVVLRHANWRVDGWAAELGQFDLILCNPPYVEADAALAPMVAAFEPPGALFSGTDGLADYRVLVPQMPSLLSSQGIAIFEIGHMQADAVCELAGKAGLNSAMRHDLAGKPRALRFSLGIANMNG